MTQQEVNRLIDLYMEGKTSPEEEHQLAIEVNRSDAPAEWKIIAEMLGELTLGEALYDQTMAERKRVRIRRYIGWSIAAVAACLTLWFVLGKLSIPTLQQDTAPQIAQQPKPVVKPDGYFQVGECMVLHPEFHIIEQRLQFDGNLVWRDPNVSFRHSVFTGPFPHLTELYRPYPKYKLWACHKMTK